MIAFQFHNNSLKRCNGEGSNDPGKPQIWKTGNTARNTDHKYTQEARTDQANEFLLTKAIKFARNRKVSNILAEAVLEMT